jgi:hypothetical protein
MPAACGGRTDEGPHRAIPCASDPVPRRALGVTISGAEGRAVRYWSAHPRLRVGHVECRYSCRPARTPELPLGDEPSWSKIWMRLFWRSPTNSRPRESKASVDDIEFTRACPSPRLDELPLASNFDRALPVAVPPECVADEDVPVEGDRHFGRRVNSSDPGPATPSSIIRTCLWLSFTTDGFRCRRARGSRCPGSVCEG